MPNPWTSPAPSLPSHSGLATPSPRPSPFASLGPTSSRARPPTHKPHENTLRASVPVALRSPLTGSVLASSRAPGAQSAQQQQQQQQLAEERKDTERAPARGPCQSQERRDEEQVPGAGAVGRGHGQERGTGRAGKTVWVCSHSPEVLKAAAAASWPAVEFLDDGASEAPEDWASTAAAEYVVAGSTVYWTGPPPAPAGPDSRAVLAHEVGVRVRVLKGADQGELRAVAAALQAQAEQAKAEQAQATQAQDEAEWSSHHRPSQAPSSPMRPVVVLEALDWKIITAENAVAMFQKSQACVLGVVSSAVDARLLLQALEVGLDGAVLRTDSVHEVVLLQSMLAHGLLPSPAPWPTPSVAPSTQRPGHPSNTPAAPNSTPHHSAAPQHSPPPDLRWAAVTGIQACGVGHRVCVDLCSLLPPGSGLLVGSFARALFLVHSECLESDFVPSRPFRVNAGPVCSYVALPGGRTAYLSELSAGSEVLVVDSHTGASSVATVGRCKVEVRPMILIQAELLPPAPPPSEPPRPMGLPASASEVICEDPPQVPQGPPEQPLTLSIFLQNAETVRLIVPEQGGSASGAGTPLPAQRLRGSLGPVDSRSVSELQLGDRVLVAVTEEEGVARHTGIAVREFILEK